MSSNTESVRCMLLPLSSINLLVPNSAVAEIIGYSTPMALSDSSEWFPGVVLWRGVYVPVVSLEEMCSIDTAMVGPRSRVAIIYNPEKDAELPYLGIHIITSRTGEKHRDRALEIGVTKYMGKPYHEEELIVNIQSAIAG